MKTEAPVIQFQLSQVVAGVKASVCVEVSAEALSAGLQDEACLSSVSGVPSDCCDSTRKAIQAEALQTLNELSERLSLAIARSALNFLESELAEMAQASPL